MRQLDDIEDASVTTALDAVVREASAESCLAADARQGRSSSSGNSLVHPLGKHVFTAWCGI